MFDLGRKVSVWGWLCLCLQALFFSGLSTANPWHYKALIREDHGVENLTALAFFLAGGLLCATAWRERSAARRVLCALGGMILVFVAGEEISWGQRIFRFATPDFLLGLNRQREFTLHNIEGVDLVGVFMIGGLLVCTVTCAAFFCWKDARFRLPLPSLLLMCGFIMVMSYRSTRIPLDNPVNFVFWREKYLLLLFGVYMLLSRQVQWIIGAAATWMVILANAYVHAHIDIDANEVSEYLFGIGCFFYALELWLAQQGTWHRPAAAGRETDSHSGKATHGFEWLGGGEASRSADSLGWTACILVMVCSGGLTLFEYVKPRGEAAALAQAYRSIRAGTAGARVARADFSVYATARRLTYVKDPCGPADVAEQFFLHVFPVRVRTLPRHRRPHGFNNLDFPFDQHGLMQDGTCVAIVPLPRYPIDRIHTGQFAGADQTWAVTFPVNGQTPDVPRNFAHVKPGDEAAALAQAIGPSGPAQESPAPTSMSMLPCAD